MVGPALHYTRVIRYAFHIVFHLYKKEAAGFWEHLHLNKLKKYITDRGGQYDPIPRMLARSFRRSAQHLTLKSGGVWCFGKNYRAKKCKAWKDG